MKKVAIVNVNMEYELPNSIKTEAGLDDFLSNIDLPENYVEDSIELVKVIDSETNEQVTF